MTNHKNIPALRFKEFVGEWEVKKLGELAKFSKGKGISKKDISDDGIECIRYGELYTTYGEVIEEIQSKTNIDKDELVFSQANDVIIPASGETAFDIATASCVINDGIALGGDLNIIRTKINGVFLSYYLNNALKIPIARLAQGVSVSHLYSSQLKTLKLNLPTKPEQQKIANFLTTIDTKIQQLRQKEQLLDKYKKGVIQQIFKQEIRFKKDDGGAFEDWEVKRLGEVFIAKKGKGLSKGDLSKSGINKCILYGELYTKYDEVIFKVESRTNKKEGVKSQKGDLLVPCSTTTTGIDLANVTELQESQVLLGGDITILRLKNKGVSRFYAYYLSHYKKYDIAQYAQGSTIVHLYFNHFKKVLIDIPCEAEQQKIANFLSSIDEKIGQVREQVQAMEAFKKGLLQRMFV